MGGKHGGNTTISSHNVGFIQRKMARWVLQGETGLIKLALEYAADAYQNMNLGLPENALQKQITDAIVEAAGLRPQDVYDEQGYFVLTGRIRHDLWMSYDCLAPMTL